MKFINSLFDNKIIVGIHGLSNKVEAALLKKWWVKSIKEGLSVLGFSETSFTIKSVYWADILYETPLNINEKDKKSPLYEDEPYVRGNPEEYKKYTPNKLKKKFLDAVERKIDKLFFEENNFINFDKIADLFIRHIYKDLDFYYNRESNLPQYSGYPVKKLIRDRLAEVLNKYRSREILLIGHSMGSIIAYDVLAKTLPDVKINTFITIGSPLGLPFIIKKIQAEQGREQKNNNIPTPENILNKWYNFSDLNDPVAVVYKISDDFKSNSRGVCPEDVIIFNNYEYNGKRNAHKLFGYLRAPEVARVIYDFCKSEKPGLFKTINNRIKLLFSK